MREGDKQSCMHVTIYRIEAAQMDASNFKTLCKKLEFALKRFSKMQDRPKSQKL
jgi:hypothetical protein